MVRAGSDRSGRGRIVAGGSRCAAADGGVARALGQQGGEPAPDLPAGQGPAGRRLRRRRWRSCRTSVPRSARPSSTCTTGARGRSGRIGATCTVSMEQLPWGGATFPEAQISEDGRPHPARAARAAVGRSSCAIVRRLAASRARRGQRRSAGPDGLGRGLQDKVAADQGRGVRVLREHAGVDGLRRLA